MNGSLFFDGSRRLAKEASQVGQGWHTFCFDSVSAHPLSGRKKQPKEYVLGPDILQTSSLISWGSSGVKNGDHSLE